MSASLPVFVGLTFEKSLKFWQGDTPCALHLHDAIFSEQFHEVVQLVGVTVERNRDRLDADSQDLALEDVDQLDDLTALVAGRA